MKMMVKKRIVPIVIAGVIFVIAMSIAYYWFKQGTAVVGDYTVLYYKNQCEVDPQYLPNNLEYLKTIPCLMRINWQERIGADMYQEYSYLPGRGVEKTRKIHKK